MKKKLRIWLAMLLAITMIAPVSVPASSLEEPIVEEESAEYQTSEEEIPETETEEPTQEEPLIEEEEEPIIEEELPETAAEEETTEAEETKASSAEEEKAEIACQVMSATDIAEYVSDQNEILDVVNGADGDSVDASFATARLIVASRKLTDTFGASDILKYKDLDLYILQYDTPAKAAKGYDAITEALGEGSCYADEVLQKEQLTGSVSSSYPKYSENLDYIYSWGTGYMGMDQLMEDAYPANRVTVAVIDTGMDTSNFMFENRKISSASYNFVTNKKGKAYMDDEDGHGTHVASIISDAVPSNVTIMPLRIAFSTENSITTIISAVDYAITNGAGVINMSFFVGSDGVMDTVLKKAYDKNIVCCASSGNGGGDFCLYPAKSKYTIAVGALESSAEGNKNDPIANYSNHSDEVDFAAPGSNIWGAEAGGDMVEMSGTSMSTPEIAAAFAYMKMYYPEDSFSSLYTRMKKICLDLGDSGKDEYYGWGCPMMNKLKKSVHVHSFKITASGTTSHKLTCSDCGLVIKKKCHAYTADSKGAIQCKDCGRKLASKIKTSSGDMTLNVDFDDMSFLYFPGISRAFDTYCRENRYSGESYHTTVKIEEGYTKLNAYAFHTNYYTEEIFFPSTLTQVDAFALDWLPNLTRVDLSNTKVTRIGSYAMELNSNLVEVLLPSTLEEIGPDTFHSSSALTMIDLSRTKIKKIPYSMFNSCASLEKVMLPSSVNEMAWLVFNRCTNLTYVNLEDTNITTIAMDAFSECTSLKQVILPATIKELLSGVFDQCTSLDTVIYLGSAPEINNLEMYTDKVYNQVNATVYYPKDDRSWNTIASDPSEYQFGGNLTYKSYDDASFLPAMNIKMSRKKYYTGSSIKPSVTITNSNGVKLVKNTDYTISYGTNEKLGVGYAVIKGIGSYKGTREVLFGICRAPLKSIRLSKSSFTYDGSAHYPTVTVKTAAQTVMKDRKKSNSAVTLTNKRTNKLPGTYTVKAVGEGNYTGSVKKTYEIKVQSTSLGTLTGGKGSVTVQWTACSSKNVSGYQIQYTSSKTKIKNDKGHLVKVKGASSASKTITGLSKGTEYIKVRSYVTVSGKTYYSDWSSYQSVKVK